QHLHAAFSAKSGAVGASTSGATTTAPGPTTSSSSRLHFNQPRPGKMLATSSIVRDKDRSPQSQPWVDEDGSTSIEWNNQRCSDVFSSYQCKNVPLHPSSGTVVKRITEYGAPQAASTTGYFAGGAASSPVPSASSFFNQPNHVAAQQNKTSWNYNSYTEYDPTSPVNEDEVGFYSSFSGVPE
ncbi:unnamed protein product, partial [Amoebophrya sp. A120]